MFYKHWNKLALALTGFFWASCDNDSVSANGDTNPPTPPITSSESGVSDSSSSETENQQTVSSSSAEQSSSSEFTNIMPAYGVPNDVSSSSEAESSSSLEFNVVPLYGIQVDKYVCTQKLGEDTMTCADGVTCTEETKESWTREDPCWESTTDEGELIAACPDYGVVQISEKVYTCDGQIYNEAEFRARYEKIIEDKPDTLFRQEVVLYGPPCVFNGTCDDNKE